jgi:hypothetical protein
VIGRRQLTDGDRCFSIFHFFHLPLS